VAEQNIAELTALPTPRGRCGAISLWVALGAFVIIVATFVVLMNEPSYPAPITAGWNTANIIAYLVLFGFTPLGHLAGAAFGIVALFARNDRRGLGLAGLLINGFALVILVGSAVLMFRTVMITFH
jgi:hypothetical protein